MAKSKFVPICAILLFLNAHQFSSAKIIHKNDELTTIQRKIDVDRQGIIGSSLFGGPLALAAFLFSLPLLPALIMAPLAIAGVGPTIGAIRNFMSSFSSGDRPFLPLGISSLFDSPLSTSSSETSSQSTTTGTDSGSTLLNALRGMSELLFSRRHQNSQKPPSSQSSGQSSESQSQQSQAEQLESSESSVHQSTDSTSNSRFAPLLNSLKDIYSILKSGIRRYEITDTDCQSRIVCELHQRAGVARSFAPITTTFYDYFLLDNDWLKENAFGSRAKHAIQHFVNAAKTGISNKDCSHVYYRCPSNLSNKFLQSRRPAIKSTFITTARPLNYYYNMNKL